ncbi:MAG: GNAT family N-acetyltransferase [Bacteroidota bacterium]
MRTFNHPAIFAAAALTYWERDPLFSLLQRALTQGLIERVEARIASQVAPPLMLAHAAGSPPWFGLRTDVERPINLVGDAPPNGQTIADIQEQYPNLVGVNGEQQLAYSFAKAYGREFRLQNDLLLYALNRPAWQAQNFSCSGSLRLATMAELDLATDWVRDFIYFIQEVGHSANYRERAREIISAGQLYFYCLDGQPVSMAASTRQAGGTAAINYVFTPEIYRGHGYATAGVGALCEHLLQAYDQLMLYADAHYAASNAVYRKLGFEEGGVGVELVFVG